MKKDSETIPAASLGTQVTGDRSPGLVGQMLVETLQAEASFLNSLANLLDGWALESRHGGWSTHQVQANTEQADNCRRRAAQMRAVIAKFTGERSPVTLDPSNGR